MKLKIPAITNDIAWNIVHGNWWKNLLVLLIAFGRSLFSVFNFFRFINP